MDTALNLHLHVYFHTAGRIKSMTWTHSLQFPLLTNVMLMTKKRKKSILCVSVCGRVVPVHICWHMCSRVWSVCAVTHLCLEGHMVALQHMRSLKGAMLRGVAREWECVGDRKRKRETFVRDPL